MNVQNFISGDGVAGEGGGDRWRRCLAAGKLLAFPAGRAERLLLTGPLRFAAVAAGLLTSAQEGVGDLQAGVAFATRCDGDHAFVWAMEAELVLLAVVDELHTVALVATGDLRTRPDRLGADIDQPLHLRRRGVGLLISVSRHGESVPAGGRGAEEDGEGQVVCELHRFSFSLDQGCLVGSKHSLFFSFCQ